jgi:hypothetical protein
VIRRALLLWIGGLGVGCAPSFTCEDPARCVWQGRQGACEAVGHCSYPDLDCPSKRRFGPHAGSLANRCTPEDATSNGSLEAGDSGTASSPGRMIPSGEPPPPTPREGIWISAEELAVLPVDGAAWQAVVGLAEASPAAATLSGPSDHNLVALANAYVCVRMAASSACDRARAALLEIATTVPEADAQALSVQLLAYVVVADLVPLDAADSEAFAVWLREVRELDVAGRTLVSTHEERPNNWGTQAGAARAAIAIHLDEPDELQRTADVFRGWLGAREVYAGFDYGDLDWHADPAAPVGINPFAATIDGLDVDGVIPDAQRDEGTVQWPPPGDGNAGYAALTGAIALGVILHRRGFDVWNWEDAAIGRSWSWQWDVAAYRPAAGREWLVPLVGAAYGFDQPYDDGNRSGTSMALTAWTHP